MRGEVGVGGCGEVGVWWYGCRCGEVGVGVGMENPTLVQNFTYLEPDSIISSLFVQSVIFGHSLCFLLNKLEGGNLYHLLMHGTSHSKAYIEL